MCVCVGVGVGGCVSVSKTLMRRNCKGRIGGGG